MANKLYLNPPENGKITGNPVAKSDHEGLRAYAHSLVSRDEVQYHSDIDDLSKKALVEWFDNNGYTWTDDLAASNWKNKEAADQ